MKPDDVIVDIAVAAAVSSLDADVEPDIPGIVNKIIFPYLDDR